MAEAPGSAGPSAGVFQGREHLLAVRVYYEDTDFTGLVYHASYVRFFERGRSDFLRLAGADHTAMGALGVAFAVVRLEVGFRRAARIDDALVVETAIRANPRAAHPLRPAHLTRRRGDRRGRDRGRLHRRRRPGRAGRRPSWSTRWRPMRRRARLLRAASVHLEPLALTSS